MALHNREIKQQLEVVLRDTKILCELEPFVKKWSLDEMMPAFDINKESTDGGKESLSEIFENFKVQSISEKPAREELFREVKGKLAISKSSDDRKSELFPFRKSEEISLEDAYDQELEQTMAALEEIEQAPAVTQNDMEDYVRGLGGKPDGPDLHQTNMREWKNIFLEQWLHLNRLGEEQKTLRQNMNTRKINELPCVKPKSAFQTDLIRSPVKNADLLACTSPKANLDSHFVATKGNKNISTVVPVPPKRASISESQSSSFTLKPKAVKKFSSLLATQQEVGNSRVASTTIPKHKKYPKAAVLSKDDSNNGHDCKWKQHHGQVKRQMNRTVDVDVTDSQGNAAAKRNAMLAQGVKAGYDKIPSQASSVPFVKPAHVSKFTSTLSRIR
ncbi:hypothetical protein Ocin01_06764 [Orchesella cincta]|uniref:Uncharacterized protein n=1 Tax=Orchesella cincta TaxID=48709 RepID=A0A1D2N4N8_ORCCI|nr:hypothetical protein Ocin01_06764 [Orchesella cincta]